MPAVAAHAMCLALADQAGVVSSQPCCTGRYKLREREGVCKHAAVHADLRAPLASFGRARCLRSSVRCSLSLPLLSPLSQWRSVARACTAPVHTGGRAPPFACCCPRCVPIIAALGGGWNDVSAQSRSSHWCCHNRNLQVEQSIGSILIGDWSDLGERLLAAPSR